MEKSTNMYLYNVPIIFIHIFIIPKNIISICVFILHKMMSDFEILLHRLGISHDTIIPGFPNQNGKVERFNESLVNEHINYMYDNYDSQNIHQINKNLKTYIKYYNEQRFHTILKKTPQQVIKNYFIDGVINNHVFV